MNRLVRRGAALRAVPDLPPARVLTGAERRHAILCVCGAAGLFVVAAAIVKAIAADIPTVEIALFRSAVACVVLFPVLQRNGGLMALRTRRPWGHVGRTLAGFTAMVTGYYGYGTLPLATVTALGFAMPLFLSVLSVPMLGERVGPMRAAAVMAGLVGVLVMLRPWQEFGGDAAALPLVPVLVVLAGVIGWALAMISIRRMGTLGERNVTIILWFSLGSALLSAILTVPVWVTPQPIVLLGLCGVGAVSAAAQMLMTQGYRAGETTLVAPFEYSAIVYTTVLGMVIWGEVPDIWTFVGIVILVAAGLVVWRSA